MSKRTLEGFFPVVQNKKTKQQVKTIASVAGDAAAQATAASQQAMWGSASPAAPAATAAPTAQGTAPAETSPEAEQRPAVAPIFGQAAGVAAAAAETATAEVLARWHEDANRALELAEQRVTEAKAAGQQPQLSQLLVQSSWQAQLGGEFEKPYMRELQGFLEREWQQNKIFPPQHMIFRAMNSCPFDNTKVVILGQDPYHNTGQAMGLSFSVPRGVPVPSSLQNIFKELNTDLGCSRPSHGCLLKWAEQGVLLLNTCLTVKAHNANSHAKKGWETFTDKAISAISAKRSGVVFLLWGRPAQTKAKLINGGKHHVLMSAHPSGLSANKGFFGSKPFSKTNKLLQKAGVAPIDWQIE